MMLEETTRKTIKTLAWVVLAFAALLAVVQYGRSVDKMYPTRSFSVEGEGSVDTTPDVAKFSVSVVSEGGKDVAALQAMNADKMEQVDALLKEAGISKDDLKTEQYTLSPRYEYPNCVGLRVCPPASISGYTLTQSIRVTVRDAEKLSGLLTGVVERGANNVTDVVFTIDDEEDAKAEARKKAIENAEKKAAAIAKEAGFSLGRLVALYESQPNLLPYGVGGAEKDSLSVRTQSGGGGEALPPIEPGTNETKVTVTLTYEIR